MGLKWALNSSLISANEHNLQDMEDVDPTYTGDVVVLDYLSVFPEDFYSKREWSQAIKL